MSSATNVLWDVFETELGSNIGRGPAVHTILVILEETNETWNFWIINTWNSTCIIKETLDKIIKSSFTQTTKGLALNQFKTPHQAI